MPFAPYSAPTVTLAGLFGKPPESAIIERASVFSLIDVLDNELRRRDSDLLSKSSKDKSDRFLEHLKPLQGALESYCRRSVHRVSEAEDILQSAVLKAYRDFDKYAEGTNFRAWIFKYLNLEILAGNRSVARQTHGILTFEPSVPSCPIQAFEKVSPEQLPDAPEIALDECEGELANAIWELSPAERSVILLYAIGSFKYREIASILELPIGTVMSHLSRGRKHVRGRLAEWSLEYNLVRQRDTESA